MWDPPYRKKWVLRNYMRMQENQSNLCDDTLNTMPPGGFLVEWNCNYTILPSLSYHIISQNSSFWLQEQPKIEFWNKWMLLLLLFQTDRNIFPLLLATTFRHSWPSAHQVLTFLGSSPPLKLFQSILFLCF